jgi:hypothetical protein
MSNLCRLIWCALIGLFRPRAALEAEILVLRHQLNILRRKSPNDWRRWSKLSEWLASKKSCQSSLE